MKKSLLRTLLALFLAAIAVGSVWFLLVTYVMRDLPLVLETAMLVALAVIAAGLCVALIFAFRAAPGRVYRAALAVMLIAGLAPWALNWHLSSIAAANQEIKEARKKAEDQAFEAKFLSQLETYKKDVADRIAARNPYTPLQAKEFLDFTRSSDFRYRSLPDYSPQAFPLLKQALDGKILDPNARVKGPTRIDVNEEPLFVVYYNFYLKSGVELKRVLEREWTLFQMLIAGGANLDDPAAVVLRDVVNRETAPYEIPGYIRLK